MPWRSTPRYASDCGRPFRIASRVERDDEERVAVVRVRRRREAELGREAFGDLRPRMARVVAAMHPDVVLLVEAVAVDRRAYELVHAEADLLMLARPVGAEAAVA